MEAPRGAREPTGTNGPTLTKTSTTLVDRHYETARQTTIRITTNTTPQLAGETRILVEPLVVVIAAGKRPAPIPNLEAKPASADGTAPGRVWESRTPPQHSSRGGVGTLFQTPLSFSYTHPHSYPTHNTSTRAATTRTQHNTQQCSTPVSTRAPTRHTHTHLPTWQTLCKLRNAPRHSLQRPRKHRLSFFALVSLFYSLRMKL